MAGSTDSEGGAGGQESLADGAVAPGALICHRPAIVMWYRLLANLLVLVHVAFVLFVVLGGLLALRRPRLAWLHLPAAAWGATIEFTGWICPLTPWEQSLRRLGGQAGYAGGFIEHYLISLLYPPGLTPSIQVGLGLLLVTVNVAIYGFIVRPFARQRAPRGARS